MTDDSGLGTNLDLLKPGRKRADRAIKTPESKTAEGMPERVRIILEPSADIPPTGLFLGHNGRTFLIPTGSPVDVPVEVLGILNDAIMSEPVLAEDGSGRVSHYRDRMRHAYRIVGTSALGG